MVQRESYLKQIRLFLGKPVIKVLTGMRRSGKSTLLEMVRSEINSESTLSINMESMKYAFIKTHVDLYDYVCQSLENKPGPKTLIVDEIQEIQNWEKAVLSLYSENICDILISGSNAHLLSSELTTLLTGRFVEIPVYPLSFQEYLLFRNLEGPDFEKEFYRYARYGGLPGLHYLPDLEEALSPYLESIINTILLKDIVMRHQIRDAGQMERILRYLFQNTGNITTAKNIHDFFKSQNINSSVDTVLNYIRYFQESFLIYCAPRYDLKGKKVMEIYDKYFPVDTGLAHSLLTGMDFPINAVLENIVFLELKRRGFQVFIGSIEGKEIDFIAEKGKNRLYFQVAYLIPDREVQEREFGNLELITDNFPKMVLSMDRTDPGSGNGISWMNIVDFLMNKDVK